MPEFNPEWTWADLAAQIAAMSPDQQNQIAYYAIENTRPAGAFASTSFGLTLTHGDPVASG